MFCPQCGMKLPDDSVFCEFCGAKLSEEAPAPSPSPAPSPVPTPPPAPAPSYSSPAGFEAPEGPDRVPAFTGKKKSPAAAILAVALLAAVIGVSLFLRNRFKADPDGEASADTAVETTAQAPVAPETAPDTDIPSPNEEAAPAAQTETTVAETSTAETPDESSAEAEKPAEPSEAPKAALEPDAPPTLEDFGWIDSELPAGVTPYEDIDKASGKWKCMLHAIISSDNTGRIVLGTADVQHHDNSVTIHIDVTERRQYSFDDPNEMEIVETPTGAVMELEGEWDASFGSIEAASTTTALRVDINRFFEDDAAQFALGDIYNGEQNLGYIRMIRP